MKGKPLYRRAGFALAGVRMAFRGEASFRFQALAAVAALAATLWLNPPVIWLALVVVMIALVLGAELFNTALEQALDGLHPAEAEFVRIAKDCAAAAVFVFSVASVLVFILMLVELAGA